jgi:hypothetical protein
LAVNETSGTIPAGGPPQASDSGQPGAPEVAGASAGAPGFGARGRVRRRARFLRKARELAYRDLGGLVFNLHRFGQRNDALVLNKLNTLGHIDAELRTLETTLGERDTVTVLREAGITACPRCAAIHSGDDRFCPNCGLSMSRHVDLPIAGSPAASVAPSPVLGASPATSAAAASPAGPAPTSGPTTASWPAPSTTGSAAATPGEPGGAASAPSLSGPASMPAKPTPPSGSAPAPAAAATPAAGRDGAPSAPAAGRSPTPPAGRAPAPPVEQAPAASSEEERTEILHPLEPDR